MPLVYLAVPAGHQMPKKTDVVFEQISVYGGESNPHQLSGRTDVEVLHLLKRVHAPMDVYTISDFDPGCGGFAYKSLRASWYVMFWSYEDESVTMRVSREEVEEIGEAILAPGGDVHIPSEEVLKPGEVTAYAVRALSFLDIINSEMTGERFYKMVVAHFPPPLQINVITSDTAFVAEYISPTPVQLGGKGERVPFMSWDRIGGFWAPLLPLPQAMALGSSPTIQGAIGILRRTGAIVQNHVRCLKMEWFV